MAKSIDLAGRRLARDLRPTWPIRGPLGCKRFSVRVESTTLLAAAMAVTLTPDYFNQIGRENLPGHLRIVVTEVAEGLLKAEFAVGPHLLAPNGFMHGGSVVALADTCAGYGAIANLPEGATSFTTVELKTNYLGTAREGIVECCATAAHMGRTTQVWDATVRAKGSARALALFRCTQLVLYPKK